MIQFLFEQIGAPFMGLTALPGKPETNLMMMGRFLMRKGVHGRCVSQREINWAHNFVTFRSLTLRLFILHF